jgi:drug/metabolite transporter (DMT)-like permease
VLYLPVAGVVLAVSRPRLAGWPAVFLAGTAVLHIGYSMLLQNGYRVGDLSVVYPIGRGTGALLAALGGIVLLHEYPGSAGVAGIVLIVAGVIAIGIPGRGDAASSPNPSASLALPGSPASVTSGTSKTSATARVILDMSATPSALAPSATTSALDVPVAPAADLGEPGRAGIARAVAFALLTGIFIAAYTLWDSYAVSRLHVPPMIEVWASGAGVSLALAPLVLRDRARVAAVWSAFRPQILGAGILSPLAYILVLTALRFTAVSAVAPVREVSVLFGVLLGRRLLGEGSLPRRLAAAAAIVTGILCIAFA